MPRSATALGILNDTTDDSTRTAIAHHWLTDPLQLANWQVELVDSCHAINQQLKDIQNELTNHGALEEESASFPFRVVNGGVDLHAVS